MQGFMGIVPGARSVAGGDRLALEEGPKGLDPAGGGAPPLLATVTVAERHGVVREGFSVHGDREGSPRLVLPSIAPADRPLLVEGHGEMPLQVAVDRLG